MNTKGGGGGGEDQMSRDHYNPYEGLRSANRKCRKLRVFCQKLGGGGATPPFIDILTNIRQNKTMFK